MTLQQDINRYIIGPIACMQNINAACCYRCCM